MKAIELLHMYRENLIHETKIEIRENNITQKIVYFKTVEAMEQEPLLQQNIIDWFNGSDGTMNDMLMINVEPIVHSESEE